MADSAELLNLLAVVKLVVTAAIVALLAPLDTTIPFLPLVLVFLVVLYLYRS